MTAQLNAKCIMGHRFVMTEQQIRAAQDLGMAMCPTCGNPATVSRITVKQSKKKLVRK